MIILGIDPGTTKIGFGVIELKNSSLNCLDFGTLGYPNIDKSENLKRVSEDLNKLISKYSLGAAAIEKLFFFKNHKTIIPVGEMRGVIILTLVQNNIPIYEFTPLEIKKIISGFGGADKAQVQRMTELILKLKQKIKSDDAADALATAICCSTLFK